MNRILIYFFALAALYSCNNDLVTSTDLVDTPIIYGLLSPADTVQYVRVERAFLEEGEDATVLAQDPDRVFYDESVSVSLVEIGGTEERRLPLERVNGTEEAVIRNDGVFVIDPNILYKLPPALGEIRKDRTYRIEVERPGESLVSATTPIVGDMILNIPTPFDINRTIRIVPNQNVQIALDDDGGRNAAIYDYSLFIDLTESSSAGTERKTLEWRMARNVDENRIRVPGEGFYSFLNNSLETDPGINRRIQNITIEVNAASRAFADFRDVLQANSGITGAEDIPIFTNVDGGRGVFASRNVLRIDEFALGSTSLDSLRSNELTAPLNFAF